MRFGARYPGAAVTWRSGTSVLDSSITQSKELFRSASVDRCATRGVDFGRGRWWWSCGVGLGLQRRRAGFVSRFRNNIGFRPDGAPLRWRAFHEASVSRKKSGVRCFGGGVRRRNHRSSNGFHVSPQNRNGHFGTREEEERKFRFGGNCVGLAKSWRLRSAVSTRKAPVSRYR